MQLTVESGELSRAKADLLAVALFQVDPKSRLTARIGALDRTLGGRISAAIESGDYHAKRGETLLLYGARGVAARRVLLVGLGDPATLDAETVRRAAGAAAAALTARRGGALVIALPATRRLDAAALGQAATEGARLGAYRFDRHRSRRDNTRGELRSIALLPESRGELRAFRTGATTGNVLAESQNLARDLSNEPADYLPPAALARAAQRVARETGLVCRVMQPTELRRRKLGAILAVGQGSENPPRLVVLEHRPPGAQRPSSSPRSSGRTAPRRGRGAAKAPTICLVGKGITFDSGGISLKPGAGMHEMKHDMSGAAAVIGALRAAALLELPLHVVGLIAAAENLPSGAAYRPGDVITAGSGLTIEVLNTDAEGRLVLCDALYLARTEFEPTAIIDLATLTGACVVALGKWCSGVFSNRDGLREHLRRAGEDTAERVWPLPLWDEHRAHIRGDVGDLKNTGGRDGGAITAAAFLSNFVGDTPWAHLDIAGTAYTEKAGPYQPRGATGVGVRLLIEALRRWSDAAVQ